jgi:hypothetical protein
MANDGIKWSPSARVLKYDADTIQDITRMLGHEPNGAELRHLEATAGLVPDETTDWVKGNLLVTVGLDNLTKLIIGTGTSFNNAHSIVGVGSSSTAAVIGDTHLGGDGSTTTAYYQNADASNPTQANGVLTCNCTYATGNANFAWQEWCWAVGTGTITPGGTLASVATGVIMLNHKVQSLGTKASGSTWTLQATVTLS